MFLHNVKGKKMTYFNRLNYTLANEDTSLELGILKPRVNHVMSVAGSGARVLPLLAKAPQKLSCVDLVQEQLYLTELRIESLRTFSHEEYLSFWGYPPHETSPSQRKALFNRISLSGPARNFLSLFLEQIQWRTPLYEGKWEKTIAKLSQINRWVTRKPGADLFLSQNKAQFLNYLSTSFPRRRWNLILLLLGNSNTFNALLYRGHFPKKNIKTSYYRFYQSAFDRIFHQGLPQENFLLELLFFGKLKNPSANPIECSEDVFHQAKQSLKNTTVQYLCGDVIRECEVSETPIDFLSLSDVPSYFSGSLETQYMQRVRKGLTHEGIVVLRHYLRVPEGTHLQGFANKTKQYNSLIEKEKVQMYKVEVYQKQPQSSLDPV